MFCPEEVKTKIDVACPHVATREYHALKEKAKNPQQPPKQGQRQHLLLFCRCVNEIVKTSFPKKTHKRETLNERLKQCLFMLTFFDLFKGKKKAYAFVFVLTMFIYKLN